MLPPAGTSGRLGIGSGGAPLVAAACLPSPRVHGLHTHTHTLTHTALAHLLLLLVARESASARTRTHHTTHAHTRARIRAQDIPLAGMRSLILVTRGSRG